MSHSLKGIDGLRAICALIILLGHIPAKTFAGWDVDSISLPVCCAYVFFVISGFLAGYRLSDWSSPRVYWIRKAKRLFPLYYSYILVSIIVFAILKRSDEVLNPRLLYYLFLVPSVPFCESNGIVPLVHLWFIGTLSLFYFVFALFANRCRNKGEKKAIVSAGIICVFWFIIKILIRFIWGKDTFAYRFVGVTCFDVLFLGVVGGLFLHKYGHILCKYGKYANIVAIVSWLIFLLSGFYGNFIPAPVRIEFIAIIALAIICSHQYVSFSRFLDNGFVRWLASVSYEIYVTQIIIIVLLSSAYCSLGFHLCDFSVYLITIVSVLVVSWIWKHALRSLSF